ncbi:hypothetical protein HAX54_032003 [Datura stramonium]|uniref:Uncharacterized protein n=1 Tax=Datura stramonium TaxID=4076 RepID=A0ABS8VCX5_DATST|nr:hypothetical protein [Datura stramonium]
MTRLDNFHRSHGLRNDSDAWDQNQVQVELEELFEFVVSFKEILRGKAYAAAPARGHARVISLNPKDIHGDGLIEVAKLGPSQVPLGFVATLVLHDTLVQMLGYIRSMAQKVVNVTKVLRLFGDRIMRSMESRSLVVPAASVVPHLEITTQKGYYEYECPRNYQKDYPKLRCGGSHQGSHVCAPRTITQASKSGTQEDKDGALIDRGGIHRGS